jgi:hypothetical protein
MKLNKLYSKNIKSIYYLAILATFTSHALANDCAWGLDSPEIKFENNKNISVVSENLFISSKEIIVKYQFTNNSPKNIEINVSFPIPPIPVFDDNSNGLGVRQALNDDPLDPYDFKTIINGKKINYEKRIVKAIQSNSPDQSNDFRSMAKDYRDVTSILEKYRIPLTFDEKEIRESINRISDEDINYLVKNDILTRYSGDQTPDPNWELFTCYTRKQLFPAHSVTTVEHKYKPVTSFAVLSKDYIDRDTYSIDDKTYQGILAKIKYNTDRIAKAHDIKDFEKRSYVYGMLHLYHSEKINYIITSANSWNGPIKSFDLILDKGSSDNIISANISPLEKISPNQFRFHKTNFLPSKDLKVLIIE